VAAGIGSAFGDAAALTTTAGTNAGLGCSAFPPLPAANNRRHVSSNDRDIPCRLAVDEIARGACMLSSTIFSFSSSVQ